jgi:hypothetical protein
MPEKKRINARWVKLRRRWELVRCPLVGMPDLGRVLVPLALEEDLEVEELEATADGRVSGR